MSDNQEAPRRLGRWALGDEEYAKQDKTIQAKRLGSWVQESIEDSERKQSGAANVPVVSTENPTSNPPGQGDPLSPKAPTPLDITTLDTISYAELQRLAKERDLPYHKQGKEAIITSLLDWEQQQLAAAISQAPDPTESDETPEGEAGEQ